MAGTLLALLPVMCVGGSGIGNMVKVACEAVIACKRRAMLCRIPALLAAVPFFPDIEIKNA